MLSWNQIKRIEINPNHKFKYNQIFFSKEQKSVYTKYVTKCLQLSSSYLRELIIKLNNAENYLYCDLLLKNILQISKNLTRLTLKDGEPVIFTEEYLTILFKTAINLKSIEIKRIVVDGQCFNYVKSTNIKELNLSWCNIESETFYSNFLSNLQNLNYFIMQDHAHLLRKVISVLFHSNCNNLHTISISLGDYQSLSPDCIPNFIFKQTFLNSLKLNYVKIDEKIIKNFPKNLQNLEISFLKEEDMDILFKHLPLFEN